MIVDANVLLYAVDEESKFHEPAHEWLQTALNGSARVGMPWVSLIAFQRIVTHPRVFENALTAEAAWGYIGEWLDASQVWIPSPGAHHARILGQLIVDGDLRGNLVTDAHLAALAIEHGVGVCSFDSDFGRFAGLGWHHPASSQR